MIFLSVGLSYTETHIPSIIAKSLLHILSVAAKPLVGISFP